MSDIIENLRNREAKAKKKFEEMNLIEEVRSCYYSALKKSLADYEQEVIDKVSSFGELTYTTEQAQMKLNSYMEDIRRQYENDDSVYRIAHREVYIETNRFKTKNKKECQELIVSKICDHINESMRSYSDKLFFLERLFLKIYWSNKIHNQFLYFKRKAKANSEEYLITKQSITYNRYTDKYVHSEVEWRNKYQKELHKDQYNPETGMFSFTYDKEVDLLLNSAYKRDYKVFKEANKNYRTALIDSIGYFEIFRIKGSEYFIESNLNDEGAMSLTVFNYEYQLKWLNYLSDLKQNYKIDIPLDLEDQFLAEAPCEINESNLKELAKYINNIFRYSIEYHHKPFFEESHTKRETLNMLRTLWSWKHYIDNNVRENRNGVIFKLNELFLSISTYEFLLIRDYTLLSISKYINSTSKLHFQWGYSPYFEEIKSLLKAIRKNHSDKKIKLKDSFSQKAKSRKKQPKESKNNFRQRPIAIAYFFMKGKTITTNNYKEILETHSKTRSDKILQKRIKSVSELIEIKGHKTSDTKHWNNLKEAMRLLEVVKETEAIKRLTPVMSTFESNYKAYY